MIVYEVNIDVDAAIAGEYRAWLQAHIAQMLALPGFVDAQAFDVIESPPDAARTSLCVHYRLRDQRALDDYLREHAPRMRADGVARFGDRLRTTRRVLHEAATDPAGASPGSGIDARA